MFVRIEYIRIEYIGVHHQMSRNERLLKKEEVKDTWWRCIWTLTFLAFELLRQGLSIHHSIPLYLKNLTVKKKRKKKSRVKWNFQLVLPTTTKALSLLNTFTTYASKGPLFFPSIRITPSSALSMKTSLSTKILHFPSHSSWNPLSSLFLYLSLRWIIGFCHWFQNVTAFWFCPLNIAFCFLFFE